MSDQESKPSDREGPAVSSVKKTFTPPPLPAAVRVVDIDIPFLSMIELMVKWVIASIPAFILVMIAVGIGVFFKAANAASAEDIDKMTTYAGLGCPAVID